MSSLRRRRSGKGCPARLTDRGSIGDRRARSSRSAARALVDGRRAACCAGRRSSGGEQIDFAARARRRLVGKDHSRQRDAAGCRRRSASARRARRAGVSRAGGPVARPQHRARHRAPQEPAANSRSRHPISAICCMCRMAACVAADRSAASRPMPASTPSCALPSTCRSIRSRRSSCLSGGTRQDRSQCPPGKPHGSRFAFRQAGIGARQRTVARAQSLRAMPIALTGPGTRYFDLLAARASRRGWRSRRWCAWRACRRCAIVPDEQALVFDGHLRPGALTDMDHDIVAFAGACGIVEIAGSGRVGAGYRQKRPGNDPAIRWMRRADDLSRRGSDLPSLTDCTAASASFSAARPSAPDGVIFGALFDRGDEAGDFVGIGLGVAGHEEIMQRRAGIAVAIGDLDRDRRAGSRRRPCPSSRAPRCAGRSRRWRGASWRSSPACRMPSAG